MELFLGAAAVVLIIMPFFISGNFIFSLKMCFRLQEKAGKAERKPVPFILIPRRRNALCARARFFPEKTLSRKSSQVQEIRKNSEIRTDESATFTDALRVILRQSPESGVPVLSAKKMSGLTDFWFPECSRRQKAESLT